MNMVHLLLALKKTKQETGSEKKMKKQFKFYLLLQEGYDTDQISGRSFTLQFTSFQEKTGIISNENIKIVVDKDEVRRSQTTERTALAEQQSLFDTKSLYFDGRKEENEIHSAKKKLPKNTFQQLLKQVLMFNI